MKRAEDSTPAFAEMAVPGAVFEGEWHQNAFLSQPEIGKALRRRAPMDAHAMFELVNAYTEQLLRIQKQYAEWTGLALLKSTVEQLEARLTAVREARRGCVLAARLGRGFSFEGRDPEHAGRDLPRDSAPGWALRARHPVRPAVPEDAAHRVSRESAREHSGVRASGSDRLGRGGVLHLSRPALARESPRALCNETPSDSRRC